MDDQEILDNIDGRMHGPMGAFIYKYFGKFHYDHQGDVLRIFAGGRVSSRCAIPSAAPSPDNFLQWFSNYVSQEVDGARGSWHISGDCEAPEHESANNGTRLLLTIPILPATDTQMRWGDVQVIGQFYLHDSVDYQEGLVQLSRSAHQVFVSQLRGSSYMGSTFVAHDVYDVRQDFVLFLSWILIYQRMTDQDLGKINIIKTDKDGSYIILDGAETPALRKLYLESQPLASREGLVGTGTTCYRARVPHSDRRNYVLKFKWRWARARPEDELLRLAKEKCVWGAVSLDYYKELETTANLRRKQRHEVVWNADGLAKYTEETDDFFQNRILTCIVTSPVGRPLHTFQSQKELLQVFRDAIKCHRSLCHDAKILHQDISPGNMIILDDQDERKPKGILIDLDSAIELTEGLETEFGITSTRPFMAIGVLKGECHTYRHDLESFLYAFLWIVITNHSEDPPETSKLRRWSNGDWKELAARKFLDMDQDGFQSILEEFAPEFQPLKPLAESLRHILFPLRDGVIWTGTDGSPEAVDKLYDGMICAFEEAVASEGENYM
ncbi:unnamed protein product [Clonostachys byssicola]|uniref:Fungal-type protein kinase domain-containing protein n=1 Tax=Clonostachys byssicola TaxID=160290 RepID=A0A9N9U7M5_9HYPO|nr:unnamed protein product [Clonostachys byssicola]